MEKIKKINTKAKEIEITSNPQIVDSIVGYKKENIKKLKQLYNLDVRIKQNPKLDLKKFELKMTKTYKDFADDDENYINKK
jgi:hypothetical protein